jgi:hypothetical protein
MPTGGLASRSGLLKNLARNRVRLAHYGEEVDVCEAQGNVNRQVVSQIVTAI